MNFSICLATLLSLTSLSTFASDKGFKNPPPVERIEPRTTKVPPPLAVPVVDDSAADRSANNHRPDPRGAYINLQQGAGAAPVAETKRTETTFCTYLAMNEEAITRPINTGFNSAKFSSNATTGGGQSQFHILGVAHHNRTDGMVPAFIYESMSGTIFILKSFTSGPSGKGEFVVHTIPNNILITDKDAYRGDNFWDAVSQGTTPLCGRYVNLIRN